MYVIVGLGNPGKKYENTKHNVGFITIDYLAEKYDIKVNKIKHKALVGEGFIGREKVLLVKPQTYMNLSGQSIREILLYYRMELNQLMIIYDDADIDCGRIRIRKKGSAGTHNGMKSIVYELQSDQFPRLRIGIGKQKHGNIVGFVLSGFPKEEIVRIEEAVRNAAGAISLWVESGIDKAMNEYNTKKEEPKAVEEE